MTYVYLILTVSVLAYVWFRGRAIAKTRGDRLKPPVDLRGRWKGEGWSIELGSDFVRILGPDGADVPVRGVLKQAYRRAYIVSCASGILVQRFVFMPSETDGQRFTRMRFAVQKDVRTLHRLELTRAD